VGWHIVGEKLIAFQNSDSTGSRLNTNIPQHDHEVKGEANPRNQTSWLPLESLNTLSQHLPKTFSCWWVITRRWKNTVNSN